MDDLIVQTKPEPYCPDCGGRMKLRKPRNGHTWKPYWSCLNFPDCKGKLKIGEDGKPIVDEIKIELRPEEVSVRP